MVVKYNAPYFKLVLGPASSSTMLGTQNQIQREYSTRITFRGLLLALKEYEGL